MELTDKLKQKAIDTYRKLGDEKALLIRGKETYTGIQIAEHIESETDFGKEMMSKLLSLTIDLLKRDKLNKKDYLIDVKNNFNDFDDSSKHLIRTGPVSEDYKSGFIDALKKIYGDDLIFTSEVK